MQSLQRCIRGLASLGAASMSRQPLKYVLPKTLSPMAAFHSSAICENSAPKKFIRYNKTIFPVQAPDEERRPAVSWRWIELITLVKNCGIHHPRSYASSTSFMFFFQYVCHMKSNIKYSLKKMWYIAALVRGMSVDEAVKQLSFISKKGAAVVKETILEAQKMAVEEHNVEFKSNLWVGECGNHLFFVLSTTN